MSFQQGDRVIHRSTFDWSENPGRAGTFVAGPGVHETVPGNSLVIGDEYAVVQFDDGPPGQAQVVRLDSLTPETSSQRATALDDIRERDRLAIPRMGDPENDPLLRAEMDRRWLLGEIDRLTEACPFDLKGHVLCDCATQVQEQVKRIQETIHPTGNPMDTLEEFRKLTALLNEERS